MENLKLRIRTPKKLSGDLDERERTLKRLVKDLNNTANTNSGDYRCFNLAYENLKYRKAKGTKIGWGFYSDNEVELQCSGELDAEKIIDLLKRKKYDILELKETGKHTFSNDELAERIAIEKAHAHEDGFSEVRYNQSQ